MASSYPRGGDQPERPSWTVAIVVAVLVVLGLVAYFLFYNVDSGSAGGGGAGGYFVVPIAGDLINRTARRLRNR